MSSTENEKKPRDSVRAASELPVAGSITRGIRSSARKFLRELEKTGMITKAIKASGLKPSALHFLLRTDPNFRQRFDDAYASIIHQLEEAAIERALHGVEEPVYHGGKLVGTKRTPSDILLVFLLKSLWPQRYNPPKETAPAATINFNIEAVRVAQAFSPQELREMRAKLLGEPCPTGTAESTSD